MKPIKILDMLSNTSMTGFKTESEPPLLVMVPLIRFPKKQIKERFIIFKMKTSDSCSTKKLLIVNKVNGYRIHLTGMKNMRMEMDEKSRIIFIVLVIAVAYFIFFLLLNPLFVRQPQNMLQMMQQMAGASTGAAAANILALILAIVAGLFVSLRTKPAKKARPVPRSSAMRIVRKKLSPDEKKMLNEIERTGVITQDSLRARLGWSKAKASTILTRLDKMNLVQKERQGKTYSVFLSKDMQKA